MNDRDMYRLINKPKFLRIPWCVLTTKTFRKWVGTAEAKVWFTMVSFTIRERMKGGLGSKIYNEYYKRGLVCMRWKQEDMALEMGSKDKSYVSKLITSMLEKGILKKHYDKWNNRRIVVYEMGVHDKTVSTNENMHMYTYMIEQALKDGVEEFMDDEENFDDEEY